MLKAEVDFSIDVSAEDVYQAHRKRVKDAASLGFSVSQEKVPHDRGKLKATGFGPEWRGEDIVFGYSTEYAESMEYGTKPGHRPPVQPLIDWAQRIGKSKGFGVWVATEKIPQEGVEPHPYMRPAAKRMKPWLENHGLDL